MSQLLKSVLRQYTLKGRHFSIPIISVKNLCSGTDLSRGKTIDVAMVTIKTSPTPSDVLNAVQKFLPTMNHKHLLQALRTLFELQKEIRSPKESEQLIKDPGFGVLCQSIKKKVRSLDVNECIETIKILSFLQVPVNSLIVQSMLQLVRSQINYINIRQIIFLDFILSKFDTKNHLVDALKLALPLVFQIHLPLELDQDDLPLLRDMLAYSCHHRLPERIINNIITGLLLHDQVIDVQTAKSVIWSLCDENCTGEIYPTRLQLLNICFDIMVRSIDELNYDDLLRTVAKIKSRILMKHPEYYHERFMDAVADYVVRNDVDFQRSLLVARVLSRIAHTHLGIVEYLCQLVVSDPTTLTEARPNLLFGFINTLSNNNYMPNPDIWKEIRRQISLNTVLDVENVALPWTKFTLELASLGHYEDRLLKRVFSKEFLTEYLYRDNNLLDYLQILTLYEAVKTFHGGDYKPPDDVLEKAKSFYPVHSLTKQLVEHVARGLGGSQYIVKNVVLTSGVIIDILLCVKGGYPVEIVAENRDGRIPIEKLDLPQSALVIAIMNFNQGCFSMNSNRLRGTFRLILDILEHQGFAVIPLNVAEWMDLPEHERTPYLIREIGHKCSEIGMKLCAL